MTAIHLTFDDGPGPSTTALLDVLRDAGRQATFFVLGQHVAARREVLVRMLDEGHAVGNHTWSHARDGELTDASLADEIAATDAVIRGVYAATARPPPAVIPLRLPYGTQDGDTRLRVLARLGRKHVGWTGLFEDWLPAACPITLAERLRAHAAAQSAVGEDAIVCLHDGSPCAETRDATVDAVRRWLASPQGPAGKA
jgi:peptidoglycan/xylan/chitin deacetylase (PgdA/CDA1 family)